jgi:hypothetical protein
LSRNVYGVPKEKKSLEQALAEGDPTSFAGRIQIGMATKGIDGPQELANAVNDLLPPGSKKIGRSTTAKWIDGESKDPRLRSFIALVQLFDMDPEWLAIRKGAPQRLLTPEEEELLAALPEHLRRAWVRSGKAMLE